MRNAQVINSEKIETIEKLTKVILKKEEEALVLMSLRSPDSYQEARVRELLVEMGEKSNYLERISGKKVDFSKYC